MLKRALAAIEQYLHTAAPDLRDLVAGIPAIGGDAPAPSLASMRRATAEGARERRDEESATDVAPADPAPSPESHP